MTLEFPIRFTINIHDSYTIKISCIACPKGISMLMSLINKTSKKHFVDRLHFEEINQRNVVGEMFHVSVGTNAVLFPSFNMHSICIPFFLL